MVGKRLKKERQRLGMNQDDFAAAGGVKKRAQISYEQDERSPDTAYLCALLEIGVDINYVLTGQTSVVTLNAEENELVTGYRQLDTRGKASMLGMLDVVGGTAADKSKLNTNATAVFHNSNISQQVSGNLTTPKTTFNMNVGQDAKKKPTK